MTYSLLEALHDLSIGDWIVFGGRHPENDVFGRVVSRDGDAYVFIHWNGLRKPIEYTFSELFNLPGGSNSLYVDILEGPFGVL